MMKEEFLYRRLKTNEVHQVVELVNESFDPIYLLPSIYRAHGIENFIHLELENPKSPYEYYVIVGADDSVCTFAEFKIIGLTAFLNLIVTSKHHKNSGLSNLLFKRCTDAFLQKGIVLIELDVFLSNTIAIGWYNKLGFKEVGTQYFYKANGINYPLVQNETLELLNYPQFSVLTKLFGFSFLELSYQKEYYKVGVISNQFIVRSTYSKPLITALVQICRFVPIEGIYVITKDENISGLSIVDKISRMRLMLQ